MEQYAHIFCCVELQHTLEKLGKCCFEVQDDYIDDVASNMIDL
jgi:hypothetical protein